jgi:hypothetical protein
MTDTRSSAPPEVTGTRRSRRSGRLFEFYQTLVWVYGGFLLGILSYAWWAGNDDLVFWPWSLVFLLLLTGLILWQRRRRAGSPEQ